MKIHYRDHFDGTRPALMPEREIAETGIFYLGPEGLIRYLEQRLGIVPEDCTRAERMYAYLDSLREYTGPGKEETFFSRSFEADPFGTARDLLSKRDELALAGWDFSYSDDLPRRLRDLAAVEQVSLVPAGFPDRLRSVMEELKTLPADSCGELLALDSIAASEKELLPEWTARLFDLLAGKGIEVTEEDAGSPAPADTDLGQFQRVLIGESGETGTGELRFRCDGTLQILTGTSDTELASYCARRYSKQADILMILPGDDAAAAGLLERNGNPSPGMRASLSETAALQIPVLLPLFLFDPIDPYALLDFLNLPESPLPKRLSKNLAEALVSIPGTGSGEWKEALEKTLKGAPGEDRRYLEQRYDTYFRRKRGNGTAGCSAAEAAVLFEDAAEWARKKQHGGDGNGLYNRLYSCCKRTAELLTSRAGSETQISRRELEGAIESVRPRGYYNLQEAEEGRIVTALSPAEITGTAESAVWLPFYDDGTLDSAFDFWSAGERNRLKSYGISLPVPAEETEKRTALMKQGINRISRKLTLCIPERIRGEEVRHHPFMADLETAFLNTGGISFSPGNEPDASPDVSLDIVPVSLPRPRRYWELGTPIGPRETESPSSLERLFHYPFIWFLQYKAYIRPRDIYGFPSGSLLYGTLFHRLVNRIVDKYLVDGGRRKVPDNAGVEALAAATVKDEGLTLLAPGNETERLSVEKTFVRSLGILFSALDLNGWSITASEERTAGSFAGIPAAGYIDLQCIRGSEVLILDLKWSGRNYRMDSLDNGTDLQLALYSALAQSTGTVPDTAYYIIKDGVFLARNTGSIKEALTPPSGGGSRSVYPELWEKMERTYALRMGELEAGRVEVPVPGTQPDAVDAGRYEGALTMPEEGPRFNDYISLCGWEDGV